MNAKAISDNEKFKDDSMSPLFTIVATEHQKDKKNIIMNCFVILQCKKKIIDIPIIENIFKVRKIFFINGNNKK
jgi:hypothetical protein